MNDNNGKIIKRINIIKKYVSKGWDTQMEFYDLDIDYFREQFRNCCDELIVAINKEKSSRELKKIMIPYIKYADIRDRRERIYVWRFL